MNLDSAKRLLLDLASYSVWRKDEPLPELLSEERVAEAVELLWNDTFQDIPFDWVAKSGMHMPLTPEEEQRAFEVTGETPRKNPHRDNREPSNPDKALKD